jgi:hypothetical protein
MFVIENIEFKEGKEEIFLRSARHEAMWIPKGVYNKARTLYQYNKWRSNGIDYIFNFGVLSSFKDGELLGQVKISPNLPEVK